jgi:hypothetical protein
MPHNTTIKGWDIQEESVRSHSLIEMADISRWEATFEVLTQEYPRIHTSELGCMINGFLDSFFWNKG